LICHHPDPFHDTSRESFDAEVATLLARKGEVDAVEQYFGLAHLLSRISDTHTQLHLTEDTPGFDSTFPLRFKWFTDGLYIIAGNESYRDAIGKTVVTIGGQAAADRRPHLVRVHGWEREVPVLADQQTDGAGGWPRVDGYPY